MRYRNSSQIVADLLFATQESGRDGITTTPLLTKANITHSRLRKMVTNLTSSGLVNQLVYDGHNTYVITEKGTEYLEMYKKFNSMAESFGLEL